MTIALDRSFREEGSILGSLREATQFLADQGVENPRLDAEVLLADVLGLGRPGIYLDPARSLSPDGAVRYREQVLRRGRREPLQYIRGRQEFYSREFLVDRRALIARPETETLVDEALERVGNLAAPRILDLGCGAGVIAMTLALELPGARVFATDVSVGAVALARENARRLGVARRIEYGSGDLLAPFSGERFDLVACNPPYVRSEEIALLAPEVRDFEPRVALDGGRDGLDFYRKLCALGRDALAERGILILEIGVGQRGAVEEIFGAQGFRVGAVRRDLCAVERVISFETEDG